MDTLLATPGWQRYTARQWGLRPCQFRIAGPAGMAGPHVDGVFYRNRRGRIVLPPFQPHLPLRFTPSATRSRGRHERQWLELARALVREMHRHGVEGEITFAPEINDLRPWIWANFRVKPRYTNYIDYPLDSQQVSRKARQNCRRAARLGFHCTQTTSVDDVAICLAATESRQGFSYGVGSPELAVATQFLRPDEFRMYVAYNRSGSPAAARVVLHRQGAHACDWIAGTVSEHLHTGVTQLLVQFVIDDTLRAGAAGLNTCGADLETVAHAKALWAGRLVPQYSIFGTDPRTVKHLVGDLVRCWRRGRRERKHGGSCANDGSANRYRLYQLESPPNETSSDVTQRAASRHQVDSVRNGRQPSESAYED